MIIVFPAVLIFGAISWLLLRSRMIRPLEATIVGLFGFFLATTGLGHQLAVVLDDMFGAFHAVPSVPAPVSPTAPNPPTASGPAVSTGGVIRL